MKAVKNFKSLVDPNKPAPAMQSILGGDIEPHFVEPPMEMDPDEDFPTVGLDENVPSSGLQARGGLKKMMGRHPMLFGSQDPQDSSRASDSASLSSLTQSPVGSKRPSGVFEPDRRDSGSIRSGRSIGKSDARYHSQSGSPLPQSRASSTTTKRSVEGTRGHARDPLEDEFPYLHIGPSTYTGSSQEPTDLNIGSDPAPLVAEPESMDEDLNQDSEVAPAHIVSESPGAADFDIYETAYRHELERINTANTSRTVPGIGTKVFLTRRIENKNEVMDFVKDKAIDLQIGSRSMLSSPAPRGPTSAFSAAVSLLRNQMEQQKEAQLKESQKQEQSEQSAQQTERRPSNPPSASILPSSIPGPEASNLEATGVPAAENHPGEKSAAQLRRLLSRAQDKLAE